MRTLILGGTRFVGHAIAADAVARGHDVVCAARGTSGAVPPGARLVRVDRDAPDGLATLRGERFDAVVDVAPISHPWVERAVDALADAAGHWTFVSSVSVYADFAARPTGTGDPTLPPLREHSGDLDLKTDPTRYGSIKVACEDTVRDRTADPLVVRAGLITGPGDWTDRFGYWPARMSRGGEVVIPDTAADTQFVDVRDLAAWIVTSAEQRVGGTFDATGPAQPLRELLTGVNAALGDPATLVPVPPSTLADLGVRPWSGPRSLPLWLPEDSRYMTARDVSAALAAGLAPRPLADAVAGALEQERGQDPNRVRRAGLTAQEEAEVLSAAR